MRSGRCVDGCSQLQGRPNYNFITKSLLYRNRKCGWGRAWEGVASWGGMVGEAELDPRLIERSAPVAARATTLGRRGRR